MNISEYLSEIGKRGGQAMSDAKRRALRRNARKPRPNARGPRKPDHLMQPESIKRRHYRERKASEAISKA